MGAFLHSQHYCRSQVWWLPPIISSFQKWEAKQWKFKVFLAYPVTPRQAILSYRIKQNSDSRSYDKPLSKNPQGHDVENLRYWFCPASRRAQLTSVFGEALFTYYS